MRNKTMGLIRLFLQDEDEEIYKRDFSYTYPQGSFHKTILPKVMQVGNLMTWEKSNVLRLTSDKLVV